VIQAGLRCIAQQSWEISKRAKFCSMLVLHQKHVWIVPKPHHYISWQGLIYVRVQVIKDVITNYQILTYAKARKRLAEKVIDKMLKEGLSIHAKNDNGETPLHVSCLYGHKKNARLLISRGAIPIATTRYQSKEALFHHLYIN
jgi:hypothetical protein